MQSKSQRHWKVIRVKNNLFWKKTHHIIKTLYAPLKTSFFNIICLSVILFDFLFLLNALPQRKSLNVVNYVFSNNFSALRNDEECTEVLEVIKPGGKSVKDHEDEVNSQEGDSDNNRNKGSFIDVDLSAKY